MTATLIDGRSVADELKSEVALEVKQLIADGIVSGLATVLVGADYSALAYERRLARVADELGVPHQTHRRPDDATRDDVLRLVEDLNADAAVTGILVLRPLPPHIDEADVFTALDPIKDIESVHPANAGLLALGRPRYVPSTVGKPAISLAYEREAAVASVDVWSSRAGLLGWHTRRADVLIVAAGVPGLIQAEHVRKGAIVIDIGINAVPDADGTVRLVGDVDLDAVCDRAPAVSPVPGGVGPITDVWLIRNTVIAARCATAAGEGRP